MDQEILGVEHTKTKKNSSAIQKTDAYIPLWMENSVLAVTIGII
jgi:hypothetical protein